MMEQSIEKILSTIDSAIANFQEDIPGIQKLVYHELQPLIKEIQIKDGKILNNVKNLTLLGNLQNKLERVIITAGYKKSVNDFIDNFSAVSNLNNEYFKQFNQKFTPKKTLPIIKQLAIEQTINDLVGQGLNVNIIDPIRSILNQNITTAGDYAKFQDQLRNHILTNDTGEGSLEKYTKQITTDAIHQYNAQYHDAIAQDLQFNWGRYVGSNITTSREFCILLTQKQWVNKKDLPGIIKGDIDGHHCKLSKTTGLPYGMIPGTNADNFKILRGGYNCGHQFFWVPDNAVPDSVKNTPPIEVIPPAEEKIETKIETNTANILAKNKDAIAAIVKDKITLHSDLLDTLPDELTINKSNKKEAYYRASSNELVVGNYNRTSRTLLARNKSEYFRNSLMAHEIGHAIHSQKDIIRTDKKIVSEEFKAHFNSLKSLIKGKEAKISADWMTKYQAADQNEREQLYVLYDILGSLTRGRYGGGHSYSYYNRTGSSEAEIFAHSVSLTKVDNGFVDFNPDMTAVVNAMKEKISDWL